MPVEKDIPLNELTAISPLDGRYWNDVCDLSPYASEGALFRARFEVEAHLLMALSQEGVARPLYDQEVNFLTELGPNLYDQTVQRIKEIESQTRHDVVATQRAFREILVDTSMQDLVEYVHFLVTSEDVNNIAYRILAKRATDRVCIPALDGLVDFLGGLADEHKGVPMIGRTHGQAAVPTTLGKELAVFAHRLNKQTRMLDKHQLTGKVNGAVGNYNSFIAAPEITDKVGFSARFVERFGLTPNFITTQINPYEDFTELFQIYQRINGVVLDLDQDSWRYVSDHYFVLKAVEGEAGSSTMAQKVNPIDYENSEGNLKLANLMLTAFVLSLPVSRLQRDLSDSTMIRNVGNALGHCLLAYRKTTKGFRRVAPNHQALDEALNRDWGILGEPVQQILRRSGVEDPYTLVTRFLRGHRVNEQEWREWLPTILPSGLPEVTRQQLLNLSPHNYTGDAAELTELALREIADSRKKLLK